MFFFSLVKMLIKKAKMPIRPLIIKIMMTSFALSLKSALNESVPPSPTEKPTVAKAEVVSKKTAMNGISFSIKDKITTQATT